MVADMDSIITVIEQKVETLVAEGDALLKALGDAGWCPDADYYHTSQSRRRHIRAQ